MSNVAASLRRLSRTAPGLFAWLGFFLIAEEAKAVRPFVTDDARIAARGQIEGETWLELSRPDGRVLPVYNALLNFELLEWLEIGISGGVGFDVDDRLTFANPGGQAKILFVRPVSDWVFEEGFDTSVQVGLRFLIDAFTGEEPVDPEGGRGLFRD